MNMSKEIKTLYKEAGIKPPKGKGMHTILFHKKAISIMKGYMSNGLTNEERNISYATAMKLLGKNKSLKKKHY